MFVKPREYSTGKSAYLATWPALSEGDNRRISGPHRSAGTPSAPAAETNTCPVFRTTPLPCTGVSGIPDNISFRFSIRIEILIKTAMKIRRQDTARFPRLSTLRIGRALPHRPPTRSEYPEAVFLQDLKHRINPLCGRPAPATGRICCGPHAPQTDKYPIRKKNARAAIQRTHRYEHEPIRPSSTERHQGVSHLDRTSPRDTRHGR